MSALVTNDFLAKEKGRSRIFRRGGTRCEICVAESHKGTRMCTCIHGTHAYRRRRMIFVRACVCACMTPGASSGGPISVDHKGPQPSESLRVNNYYRAPHASPCMWYSFVFSSRSRPSPSLCNTHIHRGPNSVIKRNWFRAVFKENI